MSGLSMVLLVMSREIRQRLKSKGFFIFTALLCAGIVGIGVLSRALSGDDSKHEDYAIVGEAPPSFDEVLADAGAALKIDLRPAGRLTRDAAEADLRSGRVDIVLDAPACVLLSKSEPADDVAAVFNAAWQTAKSRQAA